MRELKSWKGLVIKGKPGARRYMKPVKGATCESCKEGIGTLLFIENAFPKHSTKKRHWELVNLHESVNKTLEDLVQKAKLHTVVSALSSIGARFEPLWRMTEEIELKEYGKVLPILRKWLSWVEKETDRLKSAIRKKEERRRARKKSRAK